MSMDFNRLQLDLNSFNGTLIVMTFLVVTRSHLDKLECHRDDPFGAQLIPNLKALTSSC